jgi:hypothetical protein
MTRNKEHKAPWCVVFKAWRILRLQMERRPSDTEGACAYIDYRVAESGQVVVIQLRVWARY